MIEPTREQLLRHLRAAGVVAQRALAAGHHPFGAVLVGPDHETVLAEQGNVDTLHHAESELLRQASQQWSADELWGCTLYTTVEPCCMCAGVAYWANVGRVVYGLGEHHLREFTGDHPDNPTLDLPCRTVFSAGQKAVHVIGPITELEAEIAALHRAFWAGRPREPHR